jgi:hypothetical protein
MVKGPWICDKCKQEIRKPSDGYVIWENDKNGCMTEINIVHQGKCDDGSKSASCPLEDFLGLDGINRLLSFLSAGIVKINQGQTKGSSCRINDFDKFVDLFRRVQTQNYEQARIHFKNADLLDDLIDDNEIGPYTIERLAKLASKYSK